MKTVYTLTELAKLMGVSRTTARNRTRLPGFPTVRCGKRILIPIRAYEAWRRDQIRGIARKEGELLMKKPMVRPEDENFGSVLICAVRYSIGRETYMPKLVQDFIRPLLPYLSNKTLYVIERDVAEANSYGDRNIDEPDWMRFLKAVRDEMRVRKAHENG